MDSRKCISYLTIEHREPIDEGLWPLMGDDVFGCDRCQRVCPHNSEVPAGDPQFHLNGQPLGIDDLTDILTWTPDDWDRATRGSAARRATYEMFLRNAVIAVGNGGGSSQVSVADLAKAVTALDGRFAGSGPVCRWALGQLRLRDQQ